MEFNNDNIKRRNPITRNSKYISETYYNYEMAIARNYIEQVVGQTIVLYEVDLENTKVDDIYMDSKKNEIKFKTPIELPVLYEIEDATLKQYEKTHQKGVYVKLGKLTVNVLESTLEENECDIKRGDYIGVQVTPEKMEFFSVIDDGRINFSNSNSYYGIKPYYRKVICAPIDKNEFNG